MDKWLNLKNTEKSNAKNSFYVAQMIILGLKL